MVLVHEFMHNLAILLYPFGKFAYLAVSQEYLKAPQIAWKT